MELVVALDKYWRETDVRFGIAGDDPCLARVDEREGQLLAVRDDATVVTVRGKELQVWGGTRKLRDIDLPPFHIFAP